MRARPLASSETVNSLTALALLLGLSIAPTVAFVLFWKGLDVLRNDALLVELQTAHDLELPADPAASGFAALRRSLRGHSPLEGRRPREPEPATKGEPTGRDERLEHDADR